MTLHLHTVNTSFEFLKERIFFNNLSKTCENKDGCAEQCVCDTELYLLLILAYAYNILIESGIC